MKFNFFAVFMMFTISMNNCIAADWVTINDNPKSTIYADPAVVSTETGTRVMRTLFDFKEAKVNEDGSGKTFMSFIAKDEFDCHGQEPRVRSLQFSRYSGYMGEGEIVASQTNPPSRPARWRSISPESTGEALWKFACGGTKS